MNVAADGLAGCASAIVLAAIALLIGNEAVGRLFAPVRIDHPDAAMTESPRRLIESDGDRVVDLHLWRSDPDISAPSLP